MAYLISSQSKSLQISRAFIKYDHNALHCSASVDNSSRQPVFHYNTWAHVFMLGNMLSVHLFLSSSCQCLGLNCFKERKWKVWWKNMGGNLWQRQHGRLPRVANGGRLAPPRLCQRIEAAAVSAPCTKHSVKTLNCSKFSISCSHWEKKQLQVAK